MLTMYEAVLCFFIYAILGWCVEVIYATVNSGKFVNRGFLNGPYCPIYGSGVVLVIRSSSEGPTFHIIFPDRLRSSIGNWMLSGRMES